MAKLILTHEVTGLGAAGDVVEVKDGYARNYLLPRNFALTWSKGGEKQVESIKAARAAREHASLEDAQKQAAALQSKPVKLVVKAGAMPNHVLDVNGVKALATMPSREELLAKLMATMQAPIGQFVRTLNEVPARFVRTLAAVRDAKEKAAA